ncbi:uncharacterized protein LOC110034274 [Phalaenopsis equestris]|uniref:uncharacterized protein LOC110034274 n=1 Tax=Phalaenopsis equestris TaxID=78828 RepID=UPI0009E43862|nr:uncharacterized protein LOC110034274 [Phalaenopsis equestris]
MKTNRQRNKNKPSHMCKSIDSAKDEPDLREKDSNREISRKVIVGTRKNRALAKRKTPDSAKPNNRKSNLKPNPEVSLRTKQTNSNAEKKAHSVQALPETHKRRPDEESMEKPRKRKLGAVKDSKQKRRKTSKPEEVDKLDRLIEQYRSKFAGIKSSKSKDSTQTGGHKGLRRWFELP